MKIQRLQNAVHSSLCLQFEASGHVAFFIEATIIMHIIEDVGMLDTNLSISKSRSTSVRYSPTVERLPTGKPRHGGRLHYPKVMA